MKKFRCWEWSAITNDMHRLRRVTYAEGNTLMAGGEAVQLTRDLLEVHIVCI